jgi:tetratricopeptide (TPR) repeat protein
VEAPSRPLAPARAAAAPAPPPLAPPAELRAAPLTAKAPGGPPTGRIPVDLIRLLEEVESYVSLGFVDDAKEALREGSVRFKDHPILLQKIAELGLEESAPEPEPSGAEDLLGDVGGATGMGFLDETSAGEALLSSAAEPVGGEGGMDLGSELGELFGAQSAVEEPHVEGASTELGDAGLADIFKEFKKGVDKQLGKEDYDTRYNLGIAYKEMGLIDEAIAEFQLAAKDEARILECSSMLGICFLEKGMPKLAMKWFEKGLKAPGRTEEEYAALRYDLAGAHEAAGDVDRALALFTDLYGQDANFRDVATKVRDLRAMVQG